MDAREPYRLTFMLPAALQLSVLPGRHQPCVAGCVLNIERQLVTIDGPSRDRVLDQARRFVKTAGKGHGAFELKAVLRSPPERRGDLGGRDSLTILHDSEVAIVWGSGRCAIGDTSLGAA